MAAKISRQQLLAYASARRRAEIKARSDMDAICDVFHQINAQTISEIRQLRHELSRLHAIDAFIAAERDETKWLH
jgi:hypothetical protein